MFSCLFGQDPIISVWYIGIRVAGGGPYNHYIELFNPTEEPINLSQYALVKGHGQSNNVEQQAGWGNTLGNSGVSFNRLPNFILFPGQSYGVSRDVSHESLQNHADLILEDEGVLSISGDDAVGLFKGEGNLDAVLAATDSIPIDCIGSPYEDPGQGWQVSGEVGPPNSTNTTGYGVTRFAILTRKSGVCYGNTGNWNNSRGCVTDSCTNWITDTPQTTHEESEWDVHACYYPDADGNTGPGYEPDTNPNCDEDILVMEAYSNICDLGSEPPAADAGADQVVGYAQIVTLDGSGSSDLDGTIESYEWNMFQQYFEIGTDLGGWQGPSSSGESTMSFTTPLADGILYFSLTVADNNNLIDTDTVLVHIVNTNSFPIAQAGEDQIVGFNELITLDGSGSSDPDGTIESYSWLQISGSEVSLSAPNEVLTTFATSNFEDILIFILTVADDLGDVDQDTISVLAQNTTASVDDSLIPEKLKLFGNYPNPFNPNTEIVFQVLKHTDISLTIYNVYGQSVWTKSLGQKEKGFYSVPWSGKTTLGKPVVSGVYFYRVNAGDKHLLGKMSLVR